MSKPTLAPRRVRVERNIYRRPSGAFEVGFKDGAGVQRWRTVDGGILAARKLRDDLLARRGRGERVAPDPRLRFGKAATEWLAGPVTDLRQTTQYGYRNAVERHLLPRWASSRLDAIGPDDVAAMVRDLRATGMAESSITVVLGVTNRIYRFAARRLGWAGSNPVALLLASERPKPAQARRRPIFEGESIVETVRASPERYRTLFTLAALTGARVSELCALTWDDIRIDDPDDAEVSFRCQVDRKGYRVPTKTDGSARTVPIPRPVALLLAQHRLAAVPANTRHESYVFATRTGRPVSQRNVARALRRAQERAHDEQGRPTFPALHERDDAGKRLRPALGTIPSMHCFRHTFASRALAAGESVDEVAFLLGHRDGNVTRAVYIHEVADARRRAMRRSRLAAEYGSVIDAAVAGAASNVAASTFSDLASTTVVPISARTSDAAGPGRRRGPRAAG